MAAENRSASEGLEPFDPGLDHFARLGLQPTLELDRDALEVAYLARSRVVHPDRHVGADAGTRRLAMEHSAALNGAYQVLGNRITRAEYLVKLGGIDLDSSDPVGGAPHPSQAFLIDMIERREQLAEIEDDPDRVDDLREQVEAEARQVLARGEAALKAQDVRGAAAELVHHRYLRRFLEELEQLL
ncbi:MAG: Fe-S protein assembly co-chaperone HscB [Myxococcales bacterium]|nr:Fe-S protein assembly co-chaperone HscB [Myxococcales bacterium]MCA9698834.1 Fe-S protein assembly co-chaperone HscB [Myxococcales bacterium]